MNKLYPLIAGLVFLACSSVAQAQLSPTAKRHFTTIGLGPSLTVFSGKDATGTSLQLGAHAGIRFLAMESDRIGLQPELQYSLQGAELERGHLLLHYLNVPLMVKYFVAPKVSVMGGGYAGLLLAQRFEHEAYSSSPNMEGADYGFAYGLCFGNESKATISLRHQVGLANVINKDLRARNQVIQLSFGYCISKK